jgi:hypothetical protein
MPGSMTDGDPVGAMYADRFFTIPGNSGERWDDEVHGKEILAEGDSGALSEISWRPGTYTYVAGSFGNEYVFKVPESARERGPQKSVLQAIHAFLGEVGL